MATQTVEFANNIPMDISSIVEATTQTRSSVEPPKGPTALKQIGTRRDYQMIDPRLIDVEQDFNPRNYNLPENRAHLDDLKGSIGEVGLMQPLIVRFNPDTRRATLVDGECRLRAILELIAEGHPLLSQADVPCFPAPLGANDRINRIMMALTANTGKPLSQWEQGAAFQHLYNMGVSPEKIATRVGCSVRFVNESIELADAPDEVKQLLSEQAVTPSQARKVIRTADQTTAVKTLQAQVQAKRAAGNKGPVKRAKVAPTAKPVSLCPGLIKALTSMLDDVPAADLNEIKNDDGEVLNQWVSVDRVKLLKLANFLVNDPSFSK